LTSFVNGEAELTAPQVTAALGLLKKALPDLQAVQLSGDEDSPVEHRHVVVKYVDAHRNPEGV
jgi:hypothetical protein